MTATIQVREDEELKEKSDQLLFLKLEESRKHAAEDDYRDADSMVADIRKKYGL